MSEVLSKQSSVSLTEVEVAPKLDLSGFLIHNPTPASLSGLCIPLLSMSVCIGVSFRQAQRDGTEDSGRTMHGSEYHTCSSGSRQPCTPSLGVASGDARQGVGCCSVWEGDSGWRQPGSGVTPGES